MLFSRFPWKSLEIGLFTGSRKRGGAMIIVTPACLAWDAHLPQATYAWPQILCTWYNVSFSSILSFYVSRMLRRPLSIKKAYWRPYRIHNLGLRIRRSTSVRNIYGSGTEIFGLYPLNVLVPPGQIGSTWELYHWIGLEKDINRNRFLIF